MPSARFLLLATGLPVLMAAPTPEPDFLPPSNVYYCPEIVSAEEVQGNPWQLGVSVQGGNGMLSHNFSTTPV